MIIIHSPRCLEYAAPGHPERPSRVQSTVAALKKGDHVWITPAPCTDADILRVHRQSMMMAVRTGDYSDGDTPFFAVIDELARLAAGAAIRAAEEALAGRPAFSLMRPPGHHAERNRIMGFCYFNHIAIAVARLLAEQRVARVAILDFDCHHGNGTEDIFRGDDRVLFASLHQHPCYPGTGRISDGNIRNYPLPPGTTAAPFLETLATALDAIREFDPQLLAVSAGFDAYQQDPITQMALAIDTFGEIGQQIAALGLPTFAVLEGGYAEDLAACVTAYVTAWDAAAPRV